MAKKFSVLVSERNTKRVEKLVLKAARMEFEKPLESPRAVFEHGQWWVIVYDREEDLDLTFSVHDAEPGIGDTGLGFEQV